MSNTEGNDWYGEVAFAGQMYLNVLAGAVLSNGLWLQRMEMTGKAGWSQ